MSLLFLLSNAHVQAFGHRYALENGPLLDLNYSARPLARSIEQAAPGVHTLAVWNVRRDMAYGLAFYRNEALLDYEQNGVPPQEHILVVREADAAELPRLLTGRRYEQIMKYPWQGLAVYRVAAQ
jgi:hypothetical protein